LGRFFPAKGPDLYGPVAHGKVQHGTGRLASADENYRFKGQVFRGRACLRPPDIDKQLAQGFFHFDGDRKAAPGRKADFEPPFPVPVLAESYIVLAGFKGIGSKRGLPPLHSVNINLDPHWLGPDREAQARCFLKGVPNNISYILGRRRNGEQRPEGQGNNETSE
jgi:hypothetical protein